MGQQHGNLLEMRILGPIPDLLNYNLYFNHGLASPSGDSDAGWHSVTTILESSPDWHCSMLTLVQQLLTR